jgi:hypothetical protein
VLGRLCLLHQVRGEPPGFGGSRCSCEWQRQQEAVRSGRSSVAVCACGWWVVGGGWWVVGGGCVDVRCACVRVVCVCVRVGGVCVDAAWAIRRAKKEIAGYGSWWMRSEKSVCCCFSCGEKHLPSWLAVGVLQK